jgi:RNA polymerase sigma factor (sigma-70 family)
MEEKDVIQGLQEHNPMAFQEILKLYKDQIFLMITKRFGFRIDETEDIVSQTFIDVWNNKPEFESLVHIRRYLYKAAFNKGITLKKKNQLLANRDKDLAYLSAYEQDTLQVQLKKEFLINYVFSHFDKLPPRSQEVLKLLYEENLTLEEIAIKLNISMDTVYQAKSRGIKMLKDIIDNTMPDDPNALALLILLLIQFT